MRTQTIFLGCLLASISLSSWCHEGLAQNSDAATDLQSVLKPTASTDDLRLLIDLDVPVASEPIAPTEPDVKATADTETSAEQIATPAPISGSSTPAPAAPGTQPNPIVERTTNATTTPSASKIPDPIFDLGLIIKDDIANSMLFVRGVLVGSPAALAGVRSGDKIRAVGKNPTRSSYGLAAELLTTNSSKFDLSVERGSEIRVLKVDKDAKPSTNRISTPSSANPIASSRAVAPSIPQPIASSIPVESAPITTTPAVPVPVRSPNPIVSSSPVPPPAPVPFRRRRVQARPTASAFTTPPIVNTSPSVVNTSPPIVSTTPPITSPPVVNTSPSVVRTSPSVVRTTITPRTPSSLVPPPRPRAISAAPTRYQPTTPAASSQAIRNPASVLTPRNLPQAAARPTPNVVQQRVVPSPSTNSVRGPVVVQQRVVRVVPQTRTVAPQPIRPQPVIVRGQGPVRTQQTRPLIGAGGRLIGNGRIINSTLRLLGR